MMISKDLTLCFKEVNKTCVKIKMIAIHVEYVLFIVNLKKSILDDFIFLMQ